MSCKLWHIFKKLNYTFCIQGLQEATSELVNKLTTAAEDKKGIADPEIRQNMEGDIMDIRSAVGFTSEAFDFEYTFKVVVLKTLASLKGNCKIAFEKLNLECLSLAIFM